MYQPSEVIYKIKSNIGNIHFNGSYITTYPALVTFFASKERLTREDVIIGAHMVYGWMPTILHMDKSESNFDELIEKVIPILNQAKTSNQLSDDEYCSIIDIMNKSVVGMSKLLHFINPEVFPIWDSRICRYIEGGRPDILDNYKSYVKLCNSTIEDKSFDGLYDEIQGKLKYKITKMRAIEMALFEIDKLNN